MDIEEFANHINSALETTKYGWAYHVQGKSISDTILIERAQIQPIFGSGIMLEFVCEVKKPITSESFSDKLNKAVSNEN